jgi:hypothetical protein
MFVQASLSIFMRRQSAVELLIANEKIKMPFMVRADSNQKFSCAVRDEYVLGVVRVFHERLVCKTSRLVRLLPWVAAKPM